MYGFSVQLCRFYGIGGMILNTVYLEYAMYYLRLIFYSVGCIFICGFLVFLCQKLFYRLMGSKVGTKVIIATSLVGTPVHEMGHALMCLLFSHKIIEIALWKPEIRTGQLGYVNHAYNHKNLYQRLGNLFIGVGPIISGMAVLTAVMYFCFPVTTQHYFLTARNLLQNGTDELEILRLGLSMIPEGIKEFGNGEVSAWVRVIGILAMLSVSLHINLSSADIKAARSALPIYCLVVLITAAVTIYMGSGTMKAVMDTMQMFHIHMVAMFAIVFVFAVLQILMAMVFYILRKIFQPIG